MKNPESKHSNNATDLNQSPGEQFEVETDEPLNDEELENIAGGKHMPPIDYGSLQLNPPQGGGLPKPIRAKGHMGG